MDIATRAEHWMQYFGTQTGCPEVKTSLLWFYGEEYEQIGGWESPYMHMIGTTKLCGETIWVNRVIAQSMI